MLKADHPNGSQYLATDVPDIDFDVEDPHEIDWKCPVDKCDLNFVDAKTRVKHFRHDGDYTHQPVSESPEHHYLKNRLRDHWNSKNYIENVAVEAQLGNQIADLLLVLKSGEKIVVEVQLSLQDTETFKQRTRHYNDRNFAVLWLIGQEKYLKPKTGIAANEATVVYKDQIKWLQKQYFGRVYSIYTSDSGLEILPLKLKTATGVETRHRCEDCNKITGKNYCHHCGCDYTYEDKFTKYYKSAATFSTGELNNKKPFVPDKDGSRDYEEFEIARFYDSKWWS